MATFTALHIDRPTHETIKAIAVREERSRAQIVRRAVAAYLREHTEHAELAPAVWDTGNRRKANGKQVVQT